MCHGGCGVLLHTKNGRLVHIEGDKNSPMNRGALCVKGRATIEMVYHPERLTRPMKRTGPRGKGKFEPISWEEAYKAIVSKLKSIIREDGPQGIAFAQGTGRHHYLNLVRFVNALGSPNWIEPGAAQCLFPRINTCLVTYGDFVVSDYYSGTKPACAIYWGSNPLVSGPDGKVSFVVSRLLKEIPHTFCIDPRISQTAKHCQKNLQLRPGTDMALALAMSQIIIKEKLYDKDFVKNWTYGFEEFKEHIRKYNPHWAARVTGLKEEVIFNISRTYATCKPGIIDWGVAIEQTPNSLQTVRSIAILRALVGNIDKPGADIFGMHILGPTSIFRRKAIHTQEKRLGANTYKMLGGKNAHIPSSHIPTLLATMRTGKPYPIRAFMIFGNNGLTTFANPKEYREALMKMELVVVADFFKTPTAEYADYLLPAAMWPEVNQVVGLPYIAENGVSAQQKIIQVAECKQDEEIFAELARRLGLELGCESTEELLASQLKRTGLTFEELKEKGHYFPPLKFNKYIPRGFKTPSKKVELYSQKLKELGYEPLPSYREPPESPLSTPELAREFPYILITGRRQKEFFHSEYHQLPTLRRKRKHPQTEIHPEIAAKYNIQDGDWIKISSPRGSIYQQAKLTEEIRPDVVSVEHGWWYPEIKEHDHGVWDCNANILTNNKPPYDPAFGTYQLRALLCKVEKKEPSTLLKKLTNSAT